MGVFHIKTIKIAKTIVYDLGLEKQFLSSIFYIDTDNRILELNGIDMGKAEHTGQISLPHSPIQETF